MKIFFWVWYALISKIYEDRLYRTDRQGMSDLKKLPYRFGQRLTLPQNYWDGGPWAMPIERVSADDPGGLKSRLYVYLQHMGYGRNRPFYVPQHFFPRGSGLNWRYETLRGTYGLSPDDARLVISIEEGKEYSESALKVAKHRERQYIESILSLPGGDCQGMSFKCYKVLKQMFPHSEVIRIPREPEAFWPSELVTFFKGINFLGKTWDVPHRPPRNVTFLPLKEAPQPQPVM